MAYKIQKQAQAVAEHPYIKVPIRIVFEVSATAAAGLKIFDADCPVGFVIDKIHVQATATNASGTLVVSDGTNTIGTGTCAAANTVSLATLDDTYATLEKNDSLVVTSVGGTVANTRGIVVIDGHVS